MGTACNNSLDFSAVIESPYRHEWAFCTKQWTEELLFWSTFRLYSLPPRHNPRVNWKVSILVVFEILRGACGAHDALRVLEREHGTGGISYMSLLCRVN